jgi:molecular chaperone GrpE
VSERPDVTESGVTDEVTPDPGAAEAQEVAPDEALVGGHGAAEPLEADAVVTDDSTEAPASEAAESNKDGDDTDGDTEDGQDLNTEAVNDTVDSRPEQDDARLARERLEDLQRLQAEYVNYKRRVDRDRALVQERVIADVLDSLLPVLDDIHAARQHGDLVDGPFASIADKLEGSLAKFGLERFGAAGEVFDPVVHEALLHAAWDDTVSPTDASATTVMQVLQPGYRTGQRVIRPARVSVADPA